MKHKKSQLILVWLLPVIVIGGLFNPTLGYLVVGMMAFFIVLSIFKGRFWCLNLCPRGAFLDIVISKVSPNNPSPKVFLNQFFRWLIFAVFMIFLIYRIIKAGGNPILIGAVFVFMCTFTTIISVIIGILVKARGWCVICPMGTLQEKIHEVVKRLRG